MIYKNKIAIVTGGTGDIGFPISQMLLKLKYKVIILDIDKIKLRNIKKKKNLYKYQCDLTKEKDVSKVFKKIEKKFKAVDVLINNAGILHSELLINVMSKKKRHSINNWKKVIDINLSAPFLISSYFVENAIKNRIEGLIINISSICSEGNVGQSAYSASKAGLEALTKVWAKELGSLGIRCVNISPGFIKTNSLKRAVNQNILNRVKESIPIKKLGTVDNVVSSIKFVIENDYINCKTISVDGGLII